MYVKVYLSIKTTQKGKVVNRLVKSVLRQFSDADTKDDILKYFSEYHETRKEDVSLCTGLDLGEKSEILWEGKKLRYFIRVSIAGSIDEKTGVVKKVITPIQERQLEEQLCKVEYV